MKKHSLPIAFTLASILMYVLGIHIRRGAGCGLEGLFLYQFCHVGIWHLLGNLAALYSIESSPFRTPWAVWLAGYALSVIVPCFAPTEGMSGMLYAVMGILSWQASDKLKFHLWCAAFMALCFLFPGRVNGWLHVWCYVAGAMMGKLT